MPDYPELEIVTRGLKKDKVYIGFLVGFWLIWTPVTLYILNVAMDHFSPLLFVWLLFGFAGVILIPLSLYAINASHLLIAEPDGLRIQSDRGFFQRDVFISREDLESVMLGNHVSFDDSETVVTLNLFQKPGWWNKRIMIAPFVHADEKKKIYTQIMSFLEQNNFRFNPVNTLSSE